MAEPEREQRLDHQAPPRWVRVVARLTVGGATVIVALLLGLRAWSTEVFADIIGSRAFVATSGSMSPVFDAGDVVVVKKVSNRNISVGDIVTFSRRENPSMVITHRVVRVDVPVGGEPEFVTKGDANSVADAAPVPASRVVGVFSGRVPRLGSFALAYYRGPLILLILAMLLAAVALKSGKVRFRSDRPRTPTDPTTQREKKEENT